MIDALNASGKFDLVRLDADPTQAQISVNIDRERAADIGVNITGLADALQALLAGTSIGTVYLDGRSVDIMLVSTNNPIDDPQDLENIFLKTKDGKFVPMSTVASLKERSIPPQLAREQQTRAVSITAVPKDGFGLGDALALAENTGATILPQGVHILPLGEAATLNENSSGMTGVFGFALVIILLVLAAQFESFLSALIIMSTVPLGLACAVFAMMITGQTINIYSQIGLVMLVGIMAKNGILIVEFANQLRDEGLSVREAVVESASLRLRPIIMTSISAAAGSIPLIVAGGAGGEARRSIGVTIFFGAIFATLVTLFVVPVFYNLFARFTRSPMATARRIEAFEEAEKTRVANAAE
jgi:HAE1 family hydrophobic/amphiphilic exporter-1